jgi:hypothetical protein
LDFISKSTGGGTAAVLPPFTYRRPKKKNPMKKRVNVVDERGAKSCQNERIDTNDWFNDFEANAKPDNAENGADREVEEIAAEVIRLVSDFANTSV